MYRDQWLEVSYQSVVVITIPWTTYDFLLAFRSNYISVSYHLRDAVIHQLKIAKYSYPMCIGWAWRRQCQWHFTKIVGRIAGFSMPVKQLACWVLHARWHSGLHKSDIMDVVKEWKYVSFLSTDDSGTCGHVVSWVCQLCSEWCISLYRTRAQLEHSTVPEKESSDVAASRAPLKARSDQTVTTDVYLRPSVDSRHSVQENGNLETVHCHVPLSFHSETYEPRYTTNTCRWIEILCLLLLHFSLTDSLGLVRVSDLGSLQCSGCVVWVAGRASGL